MSVAARFEQQHGRRHRSCSTLSMPQRWDRSRASSRLLAAVLAFAMTGSILILLDRKRAVAPPAPSGTGNRFLVLLPPLPRSGETEGTPVTPVAPVAPDTAVPPSAVNEPPRRGRARRTQIKAVPATTQGGEPSVPTEGSREGATPTVEASPTPEPSASEPLRLDAGVIRQASQISEGQIHRMAREAGHSLGERPTAQEELSRSVSDTALPDCTGANEHGSLLSLPSIAAAALAGKCK